MLANKHRLCGFSINPPSISRIPMVDTLSTRKPSYPGESSTLKTNDCDSPTITLMYSGHQSFARVAKRRRITNHFDTRVGLGPEPTWHSTIPNYQCLNIQSAIIMVECMGHNPGDSGKPMVTLSSTPNGNLQLVSCMSVLTADATLSIVEEKLKRGAPHEYLCG